MVRDPSSKGERHICRALGHRRPSSLASERGKKKRRFGDEAALQRNGGRPAAVIYAQEQAVESSTVERQGRDCQCPYLGVQGTCCRKAEGGRPPPSEGSNSAKPFDLLAQQQLPPLFTKNAKKSESPTRSPPPKGRRPVPPFAQLIITSLAPHPSAAFPLNLVLRTSSVPRNSVVDEGGALLPVLYPPSPEDEEQAKGRKVASPLLIPKPQGT